jgi:hypothetical protein
MQVSTELDALLAAEDPAEQRAARYRRERDTARVQLGRVDAELAEARRLLDFHDAVARANPEPPKWLTPKKPKAGNRATVVAMLSDTHFDEVVNPDEIGGINAYDRDIATMRLRAWATGTVKVARDYLAGVTYDGAVIPLGGDLFSGDLHDLAETNEDTLFGSLLYWSEQLAAALDVIADEFGKVHVPVVVGNHGRMTRKPRTKMRARDNLDWLLGHMLARQFASDSRFTFDVPDDPDCFFTIYGHTTLLTHGDQTTGGGGIGGIWPPIMRLSARKAQRYASQGRTFDLMAIGHWHQLIQAPAQGLLVNGSTKGFDEFASVMNFRPERPQQALWIVTPEHGVTVTAPVIVADRKAEKW